MSRIGRKVIVIPAGVTPTLPAPGRNAIRLKGPKGENEVVLPSGISVALTTDASSGGKGIVVSRSQDSRMEKSLHGLVRTEIQNAIIGITAGYQKTLEINGVGYRAAVAGATITLNLGFSNPVVFELPKGIEASIEKQTILTLSGSSKYLVGQVAAKIRALKKPEPYKGKGIKYKTEQIIRKEVRTGKK